MARSNNVAEEYINILKKADGLFHILRDLPRYGIRVWHYHFLKTFEAFTKIWNFQKENRNVLEKENCFNEHDISETAIKIAQLYYHYFLHTSETKYLAEASSFYEALLTRFFPQRKCNKSIIRKLRCSARYLIVALFLKDDQKIAQILQQMKQLLITFKEVDVEETSNTAEFSLMYKEAKCFVETVNFLNEERMVVSIASAIENKSEDNTKRKYSQLGSIMIVGLSMKQVKFAELTIDMYRMLMLCHASSSVSLNKETMEESEKDTSNNNPPHTTLLYKPSFEMFFNVLSATFKDLNQTSILLIYISGDSLQTNTAKGSNGTQKINGIATSSSDCELTKKSSFTVPTDSLYVEDFIPFTRKPLCLVIDSTASCEFASLKSFFNRPLLCLMSPILDAAHYNRNKKGGLFTLFLSNPLLGICALCNIDQISPEVAKISRNTLSKISQNVVGELLQKTKSETLVFEVFMNNNQIHNLLSNFSLCWMVLRLHKSCVDSGYLPKSTPSIPRVVFENKTIQRHLLDLCDDLGVRKHFYEISDIPTLYE